MPVSDDLHPRSFVTKITKYEKVVNIPNVILALSSRGGYGANLLV